MCGHHVVITFNIPTVSSLRAKLTWFWLGFYQYRRDVSALTISSSDSPQEMEKVCFPRCQTIPSMCTCVPVFVYLPKSLVHTAIRTSSSEQGLQVTKMENMKTFNTFTKEKKQHFFLLFFHDSFSLVSRICIILWLLPRILCFLFSLSLLMRPKRDIKRACEWEQQVRGEA